jgi:pimeloyl-ACP methyl ester carboxylesterase
VVWGAEDRILPIGNGVARAALQPTARFVRIGGAGHLPHQEKAEEFLKVLGDC